MITTIFFLVMAAICTSLYFWKHQSVKQGNRYHRRKERRVAPDINAVDISAEESDAEIREQERVERVTDRDPLIESTRETLSRAAAIHAGGTTVKNVSRQDCIVVLYLIAPENAPFAGYELLQALLSAGLRYGKQHIFHRHDHKDGRGAVLFHCAQAITPGTFDLSKMGSFSCPGLSLFFNATTVAEPMNTMDCLLETIDQLVEDLGGQVLDEKRQLLTRDKVAQLRQQLRTFETHQTTADLFE